jgi:hypothetical protein
MTSPNESSDTNANKPYDKTKNEVDNNIGTPRFKITENILKLGIQNIVHDRGILQFTFNDQTKCSVLFSHNKSLLKKLCNDIRNKLVKKLKNTIDDRKVIETGLSEIEDQIIEYRDELFVGSTANKDSDKDHLDIEFYTKFYEEVNRLRNQFKEASNPYKEWQSKVAEKYDELKRIFDKHYPEAWIFMEFCLAVKSILNVMDFTLPFMGVIVAPPSSMKTMVIQLFRKYVHVFYTDGFTPSSLVSHNAALNEEQLQKVDMLPKMKGKLVLTPELALFFTGKEEDLQKTMGIITRVLDGHGLENDSGAQGHRKYGDTMFVWLGAAVEIPFRVWKLLGTLGHKIYFIRPNLQKKTVSDLKRIAKNNNFSSINKEIEDVLIDYLKVFDAAPEIEGKTRLENNIIKIRWNEEEEGEQDKALEYLAQLANLLAPLRGDVYVSQSKFTKHKSNYSNENNESNNEQSSSQYQHPYQVEGQDYDTDFPIIEDPSRAVILLRNLAIGRAVSQGRNSLTIQDVPLTVKVALSTAPLRRVRILDLLLKSEAGELTTSQICNKLSISQPVVARTMREFEALKIAHISAVSDYSNAELKIILKPEFSWFRTKEFIDLKEDFVPYEQIDNNNYDCDRQSIGDSGFDKEPIENRFDKNYTIETVAPCDNDKYCHTFKDNPPPEIQQKNDTLDNGVNQSETSKKDNDIQSSCIENEDENLEPQSLSNHSDEHSIEKNSMSLWRSKSFEPVTTSHAGQDSQTPYQVSPTYQESDGIKYIAFQEILKVIELAGGSILAVNYVIESVCKKNKVVRDYLGDKLTSRENRKVRDLISNIIRHSNIKIVKYKPQLLVSWFENKDSLNKSQKGETT